MSHTDSHRPAWVQEQDPTLRRHFREEHDHRSGSCDLPAYEQARSQGQWSRTDCHVQHDGILRTCGCPMCTGQLGRKRARRQERTAARRACLDVAKQHRADELDPDGPFLPPADAY